MGSDERVYKKQKLLLDANIDWEELEKTIDEALELGEERKE